MKLANISPKRIEEITAATIQAYEKITELHTDLKEKTRRIDLLEIDLAAAQSDTQEFKQKYQDMEKLNNDREAELQMVNERIIEVRDKLKDTAAQIEKKKDEEELSKIEQLELLLKQKDEKINSQQAVIDQNNAPECTKCKDIKEMESLLQQKEELIKSQQAIIDLKNAECTKFKKMSKKYSKTINMVSSQAVNNVRFVRKFPLLEARCNMLEDKLEKAEKERDIFMQTVKQIAEGTSSYQANIENNIALAHPTTTPIPSSSSDQILLSTLQYTSSFSSTAPVTNNNNNNTMFLSRNTSYSNYKPYSTKSYFTPTPHQEFGGALGRAPIKRRSSQELLYGLERSKQKLQS